MVLRLMSGVLGFRIMLLAVMLGRMIWRTFLFEYDSDWVGPGSGSGLGYTKKFDGHLRRDYEG